MAGTFATQRLGGDAVLSLHYDIPETVITATGTPAAGSASLSGTGVCIAEAVVTATGAPAAGAVAMRGVGICGPMVSAPPGSRRYALRVEDRARPRQAA
jgi:hypothetical protein